MTDSSIRRPTPERVRRNRSNRTRHELIATALAATSTAQRRGQRPVEALRLAPGAVQTFR